MTDLKNGDVIEGRVLVGGRGMKWRGISSMTPQNMGFARQHLRTKKDVAARFGVPKSKIDVPLCRECRWSRDTLLGFGMPVCVAPGLHKPRTERGTRWLCQAVREYELTNCGPSGRLFEPRRSWWRRLFRKGA